MRVLVPAAIPFLSILALTLGPFPANAQEASDDADISLSELVRQTKIALLRVEQQWPDGAPEFHAATLIVQSGMTIEANGKVRFFVIEAGAEGSTSGSSTVELRLTSPDPESAENKSKAPLADALAAAILGASGAIEAAARGEPPLQAESVKATIEFTVSGSALTGIQVAFPPFEASAGVEVSSVSTQRIIAEFKRGANEDG